MRMRLFHLIGLIILAACVEQDLTPSERNHPACIPGAVPKNLRAAPYSLNAFYQKYCDANGIPVLGSNNVNKKAIIAAHQKAIRMMQSLDPAVIEAMISVNTRIAVMAKSEVTTDIPEHSDLNTVFPDTDWDNRARGLGATLSRPASTVAEENLLCQANDRYKGEDIFVHEFAHSIHVMGLRKTSQDFEDQLNSAFKASRVSGLWDNSYAATNASEYWAEGVQSWFNVNQSPQSGIHNEVNTRAELLKYDPVLHDLIANYMPAIDQLGCPK